MEDEGLEGEKCSKVQMRGGGFESSVSCSLMAKTCMMTLRYAQIGAFFDR